MGSQGGVGTDQWDAEAQARRASKDNADKSTAHANVLALAVVDRLIGIDRISQEQKKEIRITTLARYLNSKSRQTVIGLGGLSKNNQLIYTHLPYLVDEILEKFAIDSIPPSKNERATVHSRADAHECLTYLLGITRDKLSLDNKLPQSIEILPNTPASAPLNLKQPLSMPATMGGTFNADAATLQPSNSELAIQSDLGTQVESDDRSHPHLNTTDLAHTATTSLPIESTAEFTTSGGDEAIVLEAPTVANEQHSLVTSTSVLPANDSTGNISSVRSARDRSDRSKVFDSRLFVQVEDKVLIRLRKEMLITETDEHEFAANYLLRAFVERLLVLYYRKNNSTRKYSTDQELVQRCAQDAKTDDAPRNVQDILSQAATNSHVAHSLYTLGTGIHGGTIPNKRQLNGVFDTWEPALRYMLDAIPARSQQAL